MKYIFVILILVTNGLKGESLPDALEIAQSFDPELHGRRVVGANDGSGNNNNLFFVTRNPQDAAPVFPQNIRIVVDPRPGAPEAAEETKEVTPLVKTCPEGHELVKSSSGYDCKCKKYYLFWPENGLCYREYQQGPCPSGYR